MPRTGDEGPESPFDYLLDRFLLFAGRYTPRPLRDGIYYSLFAVSPELPTTLSKTFEFPGTKAGLARVFLATLAIAFGFTALMCALSGTLNADSDPATIRFFEDKWNLWLYLLVCPTYVSLCVHIMDLAARHWGKRAVREASPRLKKLRRSRLFFTVVLVVVCSTLFVTNYLYNAVNTPAAYNGVPVTYWFLQAGDGGRILNQAGFFYVILNFMLISITFVAVMAYVALLLDALSIVNNLELGKCGSAATVVGELNAYLGAMLVAKWLAAVYIINIFIWTLSPIGAATSDNLIMSVGGLVLVGWLGTMLPRIYMERRLRLYRQQCEDAGVPPEDLRLLPVKAMRWGQLVDVVLGASFIWAFLDIDPIRDPFQMIFG